MSFLMLNLMTFSGSRFTECGSCKRLGVSGRVRGETAKEAHEALAISPPLVYFTSESGSSTQQGVGVHIVE
jgi:hypothetical protein